MKPEFFEGLFSFDEIAGRALTIRATYPLCYGI